MTYDTVHVWDTIPCILADFDTLEVNTQLSKSQSASQAFIFERSLSTLLDRCNSDEVF